MRDHSALVVAAALLIAGPAFADPPKRASPPTQQSKPATVVLASADTPRPSPPDAAQPAPAQTKHRVGRVTACRCGDPQPETESPDR